MKILFLLALSTACAIGFAGPLSPELGTYSAYTESDWTVGFTLKSNGDAKVFRRFSSEGIGEGEEKSFPAKWEFKNGELTISWQGLAETFVSKRGCYEDRPCFFIKRTTATSKENFLNQDFEFIHWKSKKKWGLTLEEKAQTKELARSKCVENCTEMLKRGELKKGMDQSACEKTLCGR